jgi:hypothetical protein
MMPCLNAMVVYIGKIINPGNLAAAQTMESIHPCLFLSARLQIFDRIALT